MTRLLLSVGVYVVIIGSLLLQTGCSGIRVGAEITRVDSYESSQRMTPTPWKCLFVNCNEQQGS